jgi:tetratricopeptide (TPR) repeat protein
MSVPPIGPARPASKRPSVRSRALRAAFWSLVLGLVGLNAWWFWEDLPVSQVKTVDGLLARGRVDDVVAVLRQQVRHSRYDGAARMKLARILATRKDYPACAEALHAVPSWWPAKPEALFLEAQVDKMLNRASASEAAWLGCMSDDPQHPVPPRYFHGAAKELVGLYILEGRIDEARRTLWKAYDNSLTVERPGILLMRLRAELERIAHDEAVTKLRLFVETNPDDTDARRALAYEEMVNGNGDAADRHIDLCLKASPDDPQNWRVRLAIYHERGDRERLTEAIAQLPASADNLAEIWKYRGLIRQGADDLPGAADAFRRASELDPANPEYYYNLGMVEKALGQPDEARDHVKRSQSLRAAYTAMNDAYIDFAKVSESRTARDPEYRAAVERMATVCEQLGWIREAEAWRRVLVEA